MLHFLFPFIFGASTVFGQDPDTLLIHILNIENDTLRANQLYAKGFDLVDKNPQLAYTYARNCEKAAKKSRSQTHIAKSNNLLGILFYQQGTFKKALIYFETYLSANKTLNNILGIAHGFNNMGNCYLQLKQFQKAESYYLQAIENYNVLNNKTEVANGLMNLGVLKHEQKQLDASLQNYEKALQTGKELNDYFIKANCLNNLAQVFCDKGDLEKALAYNYDALELRELMDLNVDIVDSHLSIAEIALKQKNTVLAEENLNLAIDICSRIGYNQGKINYYKLFSELQQQKNNYQSAFENYKLYKQLNDSILLTQGGEIKYDFKETIKPIYNRTKSSIKNMWLLSLVSLLLIIIPFVLIRYKR
jgi:tetratricopeptide (TPR) repeat protein